MDEVAPRVFVGGRDARRHDLAAHGIQLIVNLAPRETDPGASELEELVIDAEDTCRYDIISHIDTVLRHAGPVLDAGGAVLIHCYAGKSRSVTIAVALLMVRGLPRSARPSALEAFEHVRARRACAQPNPGFVRQLWRLEDQLGRRSQRNYAKWFA